MMRACTLSLFRWSVFHIRSDLRLFRSLEQKEERNSQWSRKLQFLLVFEIGEGTHWVGY
jgi:hypothetical protein